MVKSIAAVALVTMSFVSCGTSEAPSRLQNETASASRLLYRCSDPYTVDTGYSVLILGNEGRATLAQVFELSFAGGTLVGEFAPVDILPPRPSRPYAVTLFREPATADTGYQVALSEDERKIHTATVAQLNFTGEETLAKLECR